MGVKGYVSEPVPRDQDPGLGWERPVQGTGYAGLSGGFPTVRDQGHP